MIIEIIHADSIKIKAFAYSYTDEYNYIANEFNNYSKKNNLNITLVMTVINPTNSSYHTGEYGNTIDYFLKRKYSYDFYFFNIIYSNQYGPYLLDLKEILPDNIIEKYDKNYISPTCYYKDKLVGLPIYLNSLILYYNKKLLNNYKRKVPKTWEELLETGKYILNEEKKLNHTDIIAYNGMFMNSESGTSSIYQFIYSCRDSINSKYPDIWSNATYNAYKMVKKLKNEIASNEIFQLNNFVINEKFKEEKYIFLILLYGFDDINQYSVDILPGFHEGVSGSTLWGYNIGVPKYIDEEKKKGLGIVLSYLLSEELQKKLILKFNILSAISDLYNDKEICQSLDCQFFKRLQPVQRPSTEFYSYDEYSEKVRNYFYDYLFRNMTAYESMKNIDDITKIYVVSLSSKETVIGLIVTIFVSFFLLTVAFSIIFLLSKNILDYFSFFPFDIWMIGIIGSILIIVVCFLELEHVTVVKCHLRQFCLSFGYTLSIIPLLYKLIIDFPKPNSFFTLIMNHRYYFILLFMSVDITLSALAITSPYDIKNIILENEPNFQRCIINGTFGQLILSIIYINKLITVGTCLILTIYEWRIVENQDDMNILFPIVFIDILSLILFFLNRIIIINNYIYYYSLCVVIYIIISLSNYGYLLYLSITMIISNGKDEKKEKSVDEMKYNIESTMATQCQIIKNKSFTETESESSTENCDG